MYALIYVSRINLSVCLLYTSTVISTLFTHDNKRRILIKVPKDNIERSLDVCLFFKVLKDNTEGYLDVGFFFKVLNKCWGKPKRQSRMDNPEKLAALGTQDTGKKKSSSKIKYAHL